MKAIDESRKVVIVMSESFLKSKWGEFELEISRMEMFQQDRPLLIVIMLDKIENHRMPSTLLKVWQKITCLEADEAIVNEQIPDINHRFWKSLYETIKM